MNRPLFPQTKQRLAGMGSNQAAPVSIESRTDADFLENLGLYRVAIFFLLGSLLWKSPAFPMLFDSYRQIPLHDGFFPMVLRSPWTLMSVYVLVVSMGAAVFVSNSLRIIRLQSVVTLVGMYILCIHQGSYNDATYVTCFWTAAWIAWFAWRITEPTQVVLPKARRISLMIVSMIFLGGAVGKWTPGYWSGEALYQIYFLDRDFWVFNWIRQTFEPDQVRNMATWYSRMVVLTESCCAGLWLLPPRLGAVIAMTVFIGIVVFSNPYLFSVMLCLLGLMLVCLHEPLERD